MRASIKFLHNIFWQLNQQSFTLITTCLLVILVAFGCQKDPGTVDVVPEPPIIIQVPDTTAFIQQAKQFADDAQLPVKLNDITIANTNEIQDLKKELYEILAEKSGKSLSQVTKDGDRDYWMTAPEAKKYGLIDGVLARKGKK